MKLFFLGAAQQVTGSMFLLETNDNFRILIDCGIDMERRRDEALAVTPLFDFEPSSINLVVLTHAHIDHSGNIPNLYKEGYEGQVLCTLPTLDLTNLLLNDIANINRQKLYTNSPKAKKNKKRPPLLKSQRKDLYFEPQVKDAIENFVTIPFNKRFRVADAVEIMFVPAGHLLGAAHVLFYVLEENNITKTICFSGDIGRRGYPLHIDPQPVSAVDFLVCESTYGSRVHDVSENALDALERAIIQTCVEKPGRLIIPAFSVGRSQALLYCLNKLYTERNIAPIKVFSDSPLAYRSSKVYEKYVRLLNSEARRFQEENDSLFDFENLQYIQSEKSSKQISTHHEPCIIISSSGMVQGGRVEQHIAANISNPYCTILMVGFAAEGTLGYDLLNGQRKTLRVGKHELPVLAQIQKIDVFSGHADAHDLLAFVKSQDPAQLKKLFLVHGDLVGMPAFAKTLEENGYTNIEMPTKGQMFEL